MENGVKIVECKRCGECCHFKQSLRCGGSVRTRCIHLTDKQLCDRYDDRPQACVDHHCPQLKAHHFRQVRQNKELTQDILECIPPEVRRISSLHRVDLEAYSLYLWKDRERLQRKAEEAEQTRRFTRQGKGSGSPKDLK